MSLAQKSFLTAVVAPIALAASGLASNAQAALPAVGQCVPAQDVVTQLPNSPYSTLIAFDRSMLTNQGEKVFRRNSIVANADLTSGFYFARNNKDEICNEGQLTSIILADNRDRKVDPRTVSNTAPNADNKNGINAIIKHGAQNTNKYPIFQAKITNIDGDQGVLTVASNPDTREGMLLFSKVSGVLVRTDALESGEVNGKKYGVQYSSVALATLDKMKVAQVATGGHPLSVAVLEPRP